MAGRKAHKRTFQSTIGRQKLRSDPAAGHHRTPELPIASQAIAPETRYTDKRAEDADDDDISSLGSMSHDSAGAATKKRVKLEDPRTHEEQRTSRKRPASPHTPQVSYSLDEDWCSQFTPSHCKDLGIHPKKVEEVRSWVRKALYETDEPKLLILRGPTGSGKSTLVNAVVQDLQARSIHLRHHSAFPGSAKHYGTSFPQSSDLLGDINYAGRLAVDRILADRSHTTEQPENYFKSRMPVLVYEDADQFLSREESYSESLRTAVHRYLCTTSRREIGDGRVPDLNPGFIVPPIILVITESNSLTTEFRPSLILGETVIKHPRTTVVELNATAPTILRKVLERIVEKVRDHYTQANYKLLKSLCLEFASSGNIRNAINSLQFRAWTLRNGVSETIQTTQGVDLMQVRSSPSLFHSAGKVLYNKRGEESQTLVKKGSMQAGDKLNTAISPRDRPLPPVEEVVRIAEGDTILFVSTLYENYLLSCGNQDHATDVACVLSLADIFLQARENGASYRQTQSRVFINAEHSNSLMALGLDFAIRGTMRSLPWPVVRTVLPEGPRSHVMRYPEIERIQMSLSRKKFDSTNHQKPENAWIGSPASAQGLHGPTHQRQICNDTTIRLDDINRGQDKGHHKYYKLTMSGHPSIEDARKAGRSESPRTKFLDDDIEEVM